MSDELINNLASLQETIETIQEKMKQGMTQEEKEAAIKQVSQTIELLQNLQSSEALKTARVVDSSDEESPLK